MHQIEPNLRRKRLTFVGSLVGLLVGLEDGALVVDSLVGSCVAARIE